MGSDDDLTPQKGPASQKGLTPQKGPTAQKSGATSPKPTVKTFHDDIGVLNHLKKLASEGVPKTSVHVFAHDSEGTDCIVGDRAVRALRSIGDFVTDRRNERDDDLRRVFRDFGFGPDETDKFERELDDGAILLLIEDPQISRDE